MILIVNIGYIHNVNIHIKNINVVNIVNPKVYLVKMIFCKIEHPELIDLIEINFWK